MRALKLLFAVTTAVGLVAAALAALTPIDGCLLPDFTLAPDAGGPPPPPMEAGPPACGATYPPPPGGADTGADAGPIVLAVHAINMGDDDTSDVPPGYDLDQTCTCINGGGPSCLGRSPDPKTYCDAPGGIDAQTVLLIQLIQTAIGAGSFGSDFFNAGITGGQWTMLIEITGYNGQPDDPFVEVALYPSSGYDADAGVPAWQGADPWYVNSTSLVPGDGGPGEIPEGDAGLVAKYTSDGAYVNGGVLVASLPQSQVIFTGAAGTSSLFKLDLSNGVLTGKLVANSTPQGVQYSLEDGIIAARWALTDLFDDLASYRDPNGNAICTGSIQYSVAKSTICNDADILVNAAEPASTPCDALSFGLGFSADQALLGKVVVGDAMPDGGCAPDASPAGDFCPPPM